MANKTYALSDLHGHYDVLLAMLKKIHFDDSDTLYILGDCNDRGDKAMEIYHFIQQHSNNIFLLKGNHELMMRDFLLREEDWDCPEGRLWKSNGGAKTLQQMETFLQKGCISQQDFQNKKREFKSWLTEYVNSLPSFVELNISGQPLVLIHAGINPDAPLSEQDEEICAWIRDWFYLSPAIKGKTIIFGHTPLCYIRSDGGFDVWFDPIHQDKIGIDGGLAPFDEGQLNCICLNDMSVNVVKKSEVNKEKNAAKKEEI